MRTTKLTGWMGAEISDLRLDQPISADLGEALRAALRAHQMIVVRAQHLDIAAQKRVTQVFGPLMQLPMYIPHRRTQR